VERLLHSAWVSAFGVRARVPRFGPRDRTPSPPGRGGAAWPDTADVRYRTSRDHEQKCLILLHNPPAEIATEPPRRATSGPRRCVAGAGMSPCRAANRPAVSP
jgi:hypothetical protein